MVSSNSSNRACWRGYSFLNSYSAGLKLSPMSPGTNQRTSGLSSLHERWVAEHMRHVQHQEETLRNGGIITLLNDLRPLWVLFFNSCAVFSLLSLSYSSVSVLHLKQGLRRATQLWPPCEVPGCYCIYVLILLRGLCSSPSIAVFGGTELAQFSTWMVFTSLITHVTFHTKRWLINIQSQKSNSSTF